jgi:peptidase E
VKHLILSGGKPTESEAWVRALVAHAGPEARIALCLFAAEDPNMEQQIADGVSKVITKWAGKVQVSFKALTADNFALVSEWANVVVIPGGSPMKLTQELEPHGDLLQLWDGKTISGASAGADIMCRRYVYLQDKSFHDGLGWVAANFIPHWQAETWEGWASEDWDWAARELAETPGKTPLLTVREGHFVEITVQ